MSTLADLFDKAPNVTPEERRQIVRELRAKRLEWEEEERTSKSRGRRANPNKGVSKKRAGKIDLSSLDLDIPE